MKKKLGLTLIIISIFSGLIGVQNSKPSLFEKAGDMWHDGSHYVDKALKEENIDIGFYTQYFDKKPSDSRKKTMLTSFIIAFITGFLGVYFFLGSNKKEPANIEN